MSPHQRELSWLASAVKSRRIRSALPRRPGRRWWSSSSVSRPGPGGRLAHQPGDPLAAMPLPAAAQLGVHPGAPERPLDSSWTAVIFAARSASCRSRCEGLLQCARLVRRPSAAECTGAGDPGTHSPPSCRRRRRQRPRPRGRSRKAICSLPLCQDVTLATFCAMAYRIMPPKPAVNVRSNDLEATSSAGEVASDLLRNGQVFTFGSELRFCVLAGSLATG